jgi:hypothetical protein
VLNADAFTDLQYRVPSKVIGVETIKYGSPTALLSPRQTTFGARWSF